MLSDYIEIAMKL